MELMTGRDQSSGHDPPPRGLITKTTWPARRSRGRGGEWGKSWVGRGGGSIGGNSGVGSGEERRRIVVGSV